MTTIDLHESFTSLKEEILDLFNKEVNRLNKETNSFESPIILYKENKDNLDDCLRVDIIDYFNGVIFTVHVTEITKFGAFTGQCTTDYCDKNVYSINDIADYEHKIKFIEILEKL